MNLKAPRTGLRLDYINAIGPTDAWTTLTTVTLTNTSQLFFEAGSLGQPRQLYRIASMPSYATAAPAYVSGLRVVSHGPATVTSDSVSVSSSLTGTVFYRWTLVSGDSAIVPTNPTGATTAFRASLYMNSIRTAVYQCRVSGTGGPVTTNPVQVELSVESSF